MQIKGVDRKLYCVKSLKGTIYSPDRLYVLRHLGLVTASTHTSDFNRGHVYVVVTVKFPVSHSTFTGYHSNFSSHSSTDSSNASSNEQQGKQLGHQIEEHLGEESKGTEKLAFLEPLSGPT